MQSIATIKFQKKKRRNEIFLAHILGLVGARKLKKKLQTHLPGYLAGIYAANLVKFRQEILGCENDRLWPTCWAIQHIPPAPILAN